MSMNIVENTGGHGWLLGQIFQSNVKLCAANLMSFHVPKSFCNNLKKNLNKKLSPFGGYVLGINRLTDYKRQTSHILQLVICISY